MRAFSRDYAIASSSSPTLNVRSSSSARQRSRAELSAGLARARKALAHNVGACGDSLRYLATTTDGYTLDNPYGRVALPTDVTGWRTLCRGALMDLVREHYTKLGEIEPKQEGENPYPQYNALLPRYNAIVEKVNALDDVGGLWTGSGVTEAIAYCTTLAAEQICFLEDVRKVIVGIGGETALPSLPGAVKPAPPPASVMDIAGVAWKLGAVAIVAYVIVNAAKG